MRRSIIAFIFILLITLSIVNAFPSIHKRHDGGNGDGGNNGGNNDGSNGGNNDGNNDGSNGENNETGFQPCPYTPINVTVNPDPPVAGRNSTFEIWGRLARTIPNGSQIDVIYANLTQPPTILGNPFSTSFCDKVQCPLQNYTEFDVRFQAPTPYELSEKYAILVSIMNQTQVLGCAVDLVGIDQYSSSYNSSYYSSLWG